MSAGVARRVPFFHRPSMTASTTAQTVPGIAAFPYFDPAIIGDVALQGSVNSTDAGAMTQEVGSLARVSIPYAPIGLAVRPAGPSAFLTTDAGRRMSTITHGILSSAGVGRAFGEMAPTLGESWALATGDWLSDLVLVNPVRQSQDELLASLGRPVDSATPRGEGVTLDPMRALSADEAEQRTELLPLTGRNVRKVPQD